ncbi:hypothetical protein [Sinorhizobium meliloti]|uniref:hypothetical protein n=1 Tax=Rhizobium meliloti TaxID=382 RepID=UPI000FD90987|nr:hypothetical protein [Sinorhizobium meliloti]RVM17878.1 hypothetical protein CN134_07520 [Sinorhizobium meliloti]RVO34212.1 hypothetical protein CN098_07205 [Sinorhizobium meliloti]
MAEEADRSIADERAETQGTRKDENPAFKRGIVVLAVVAFIGFALWSMRSQQSPSDGNQPERVVIRQTTNFEPAREPVTPAVAIPQVQLPTPVVMQQTVPEVDPLLESARRAPVMAFGSNSQSSANRGTAGSTASGADSGYLPLSGVGGFPGQPQPENDDQRFNRMLTPTTLQGSKAGYLGNRNFIIATGTSIPCTLETAIVAGPAHAGPVKGPRVAGLQPTLMPLLGQRQSFARSFRSSAISSAVVSNLFAHQTMERRSSCPLLSAHV